MTGRTSSIIQRGTTKSQKILPPNSRAAAPGRDLAKDSACGENSFARPKNPNRSRIPRAVDTHVATLDRITVDRLKSDPGTTTGHQACQMRSPSLWFGTVCVVPRGMHLYARRLFDAQTAIIPPPASYCNRSRRRVQRFFGQPPKKSADFSAHGIRNVKVDKMGIMGRFRAGVRPAFWLARAISHCRPS